MQQRLVNRELNREIRMLGLPFQASLLVGTVFGLVIVLTQFMIASLVGTAFYFVILRAVRKDIYYLDWLVGTIGQRRSYGMRRD